MKKIFKILVAVIFVCLSVISYGQATGNAKFNYQALICNAKGLGVPGINVDIRFQIYDAIVAGNLVYQEDFINTFTGTNGVVNIQVGGNGNVPLNTLNWGMVNYYVNIQMKDTGSFTNINTSRTQLLSVPYALFSARSDTAKYAQSVPPTMSVPVGTILIWAGNTTVPNGWLLCDGREFNISSYPALFGVIGTNWGAGSSSSTFVIPDLRGMFIRGVDMGVNRDPDRGSRTALKTGGNSGDNVGSYQGDAFRSHTHSGSTSTDGAHTHGYGDNTGQWRNNGGAQDYPDGNDGYNDNISRTTSSSGSHSHSLNINPQGGNETRPCNVNVFYIIKY